MGRGAHTKGMITLSRFRYLGSHCLGERGRHLALDVAIWRTAVSTGECISKRPVSMAGYIFSEGFFFFGGVPERGGPRGVRRDDGPGNDITWHACNWGGFDVASWARKR